MNAKDYWNLFMETGAPEVYVSYCKQRKLEEDYVSDHLRTGASGNRVQ